jgi:hypothetical protein
VTRKIVRGTPRAEIPCTCSATSVKHEDGSLVVRGPGWVKENRSIRCGKCPWEYPFAPRVVWETGTGARYTTRGYVRGEEHEKRRIS